jgi:hypothetical protein
LDVDTIEERMRGLLGDGALVDVVADHAEGEDGGSEGIASDLGVSTKELC